MNNHDNISTTVNMVSPPPAWQEWKIQYYIVYCILYIYSFIDAAVSSKSSVAVCNATAIPHTHPGREGEAARAGGVGWGGGGGGQGVAIMKSLGLSVSEALPAYQDPGWCRQTSQH